MVRVSVLISHELLVHLPLICVLGYFARDLYELVASLLVICAKLHYNLARVVTGLLCVHLSAHVHALACV